MRHPPDARANDDLIVGAPIAGIPYRWIALGLVCLGVFLGTIDTSIVNIALPTLAEEFDVSTDDVLWVTLIFIVVSTGLSLIMGRLGDLYGRKHLYTIGFALFTAAAGLSAIAGSLPELLGARVIQAIGSSMVLANGAAIVTATFPASERGRGLGIQVATVGAGVASGPVLGGLLVDALDWRAIFWTRVPLGIVGSILVWRFLLDTPPDRRPRGLDLGGSFVIFAMLGALVLAVNRGAAWGWTSTPIVALFAVGSGLVLAFVAVERRVRSPVVDLALFRDRGYSAAVTAAILQFFGLSAVIILMPFFLVDGRGFDTLEAGGIMAAFPLAMLIISPISGVLTDRFGSRFLATLGLAVVTAGLLTMTTIDADTSVLGIIVRLFFVGTGTAIFSSPNTAAIMSSVPPDRLGTASASQTTARTIGNAIGIAVAGAIFASEAASYALSRSPDGLADPAVRADAYVNGIEVALIVAAVVAAVGIPASLLRGRPPVREVRPDEPPDLLLARASPQKAQPSVATPDS